jgi:hypothetical protein
VIERTITPWMASLKGPCIKKWIVVLAGQLIEMKSVSRTPLFAITRETPHTESWPSIVAKFGMFLIMKLGLERSATPFMVCQ